MGSSIASCKNRRTGKRGLGIFSCLRTCFEESFIEIDIFSLYLSLVHFGSVECELMVSSHAGCVFPSSCDTRLLLQAFAVAGS